jgi:hypothetical protein
MRARKLTLAALALTAGLSLTACQGSDSNASKDTSKSSSESESSSSASSGKSNGSNASDKDTTTQAGGGGGKGINTGPCKTANLAFSSTHGMGEGDYTVRLKNTGDACSLKGFPGVDLNSPDAGKPLSAKRSDKASPTVVLNSGETTRFHLHYPPNTTGGSGVDITSLTVTPPNETHSKKLPVRLNLPVQEGADQKVTVDPVGTGKQ